MTIGALSWNLFHGRDFPPNPALFTWRSRLLRVTERDRTHVQVNRELLAEFSRVLAAGDWNVALLQECPPRWWRDLAGACEAEIHGVLTSRNSLAPVRSHLARLNPDLIASNEGGSNLTLVRAATIVEARELELRPGPRPERRAMAFTVVSRPPAGELCVANMHLSTGPQRRALAEAELLAAVERALGWARDRPLILGGDLNLRPRDTPVYGELDRRHRLRGATSPDALDHLLVRGLNVVTPPAAWPSERREIDTDGRALRLSDHAPVEVELEPGVSASPAVE